MLVGIPVTQVRQEQTFYFAQKAYVLANDEEQRRHPARGTDSVMAYMLGDKRHRTPVSFNPELEVFVHK